MKTILRFENSQFENNLNSYTNQANQLNQLLDLYRQIKGAPIQDKEEGEKIRLEPLKSVLELIGNKSGFPSNPLDFQLSASGLGMDYQTFINYLEGKDQILKLDIYEFKQGHFEVSQKALDQLEKDLTTYATDDQLPKLQYFQKLAESLNNGIEIGYISENQRANICRAIQGLELQVKNGKYVIGLNTRSLFNS
jgi:hypothetical protein